MEDIVIIFILGILVGFIIGLIIGLKLKDKISIKLEKVLGFILFFAWLGMHIYGFTKGISIDTTFNIIGGASVGMMLGINVSDEIKDLIIKKNSKND